MPLALRRLGRLGGRILVLGARVRLGRDPGLEIVVEDARVRPHHARLRPLKGEWVVAAEGDAPLFVNGREVPLFALRHGDTLALADPRLPDAPTFLLEDGFAGAFVPPGVALLTAWLAHPAARAPGAGPAAYGVDPATQGPGRVALPGQRPGEGGPCLVEVGAALAGPVECERALEAAVSLAGAPHRGLAHVVDAGVWVGPLGPRPWIVSRVEPGVSAAEACRGPSLGIGAWLRSMADAARGLAWLHRRGCLLRRVAPDRLVLLPGGGAVLGGYLDARTWRQGLAPEPQLAGPEGFGAPEEGREGGPAITAAVDVYGLCAVGHALLLGGRASADPHALARHAGQGRPPPRLAAAGVEVPPDLEQALAEGLAREPAQRPNAADLARRFEGLAALWGMELA